MHKKSTYPSLSHRHQCTQIAPQNTAYPLLFTMTLDLSHRQPIRHPRHRRAHSSSILQGSTNNPLINSRSHKSSPHPRLHQRKYVRNLVPEKRSSNYINHSHNVLTLLEQTLLVLLPIFSVAIAPHHPSKTTDPIHAPPNASLTSSLLPMNVLQTRDTVLILQRVNSKNVSPLSAP